MSSSRRLTTTAEGMACLASDLHQDFIVGRRALGRRHVVSPLVPQNRVPRRPAPKIADLRFRIRQMFKHWKEFVEPMKEQKKAEEWELYKARHRLGLLWTRRLISSFFQRWKRQRSRVNSEHEAKKLVLSLHRSYFLSNLDLLYRKYCLYQLQRNFRRWNTWLNRQEIQQQKKFNANSVQIRMKLTNVVQIHKQQRKWLRARSFFKWKQQIQIEALMDAKSRRDAIAGLYRICRGRQLSVCCSAFHQWHVQMYQNVPAEQRSVQKVCICFILIFLIAMIQDINSHYVERIR